MLAHALALVLASAACGGQEAARAPQGLELPEPGEPLSAAWQLEIAHGAVRERLWDVARGAAAGARETAERGSPVWFEAAGVEARACFELWRPEDLTRILRDVQAELAARAEWARDDPVAAQLPVPARLASQDATIFGLFVLQAEGRHDLAARSLEAYVHLLFSERIEPAPLVLRAAIACARSHALVGRPDRAREILRVIRDRSQGSLYAAAATVLLASLGEERAYRGVFAGDAAHEARAAALLELVPRARAAAERALGADEGFLGRVLVGVADGPDDSASAGSVVLHDPRRPSLDPIVCVYSQILLLETREELEARLVHDFVRAGCSLAIGLEHARLPAWVREGIPTVLAGQADAKIEWAVAMAVWIDPASLVGGRERRRLRPLLGLERALDPIGESLGDAALEALERDFGAGSIRRLVAALAKGRTYEEAVGAALDVTPGELRARCEAFGLEKALAVLAPVAPFLPRLVELREVTVDEQRLARADALLAEDAPPLVRSYARLARAQALEAAGRAADALAEYDALLADPERVAFHAVTVRAGRARALARVRPEEGRRLLEELRDGGATPEIRAGAEKALAELAEDEER